MSFTPCHENVLMVILDFMAHIHNYFLRRQVWNGTTHSKGVDIIKALNTSWRPNWPSAKWCWFPSIPAAIDPCLRSCPFSIFFWTIVSSAMTTTLRRKAQKCRWSVPLHLSFYWREITGGGFRMGAESGIYSIAATEAVLGEHLSCEREAEAPS